MHAQETPTTRKKSLVAKRLNFSTEAVDGDSFTPPTVTPAASEAHSSIPASAAAQARLDRASSFRLRQAEKRNKELETKLASAYMQVCAMCLSLGQLQPCTMTKRSNTQNSKQIARAEQELDRSRKRQRPADSLPDPADISPGKKQTKDKASALGPFADISRKQPLPDDIRPPSPPMEGASSSRLTSRKTPK